MLDENHAHVRTSLDLGEENKSVSIFFIAMTECQLIEWLPVLQMVLRRWVGHSDEAEQIQSKEVAA